MLGTDDILDDAHWVNVQDPIKQMFLSITKALRVQASSIRDLDRKCNDLASKEQVQHQLRALQDNVCSKQDATQIIYQLENRVSEKEFASLQAKHLQAMDTISRLQDQLDHQLETIQQLQLQTQHLTQEIEKLQHPNYDQIFGYMDRHINQLSADFDRKLAIKMDRKEVESVVPQRLEDLYRNLNGKYHELKVEVQKSATKEEVVILAQNKADRNEVKDFLLSERESRLSKSDIQALISAQNKGLYNTITALEKNVNFAQQKVDSFGQEMHDKMRLLHSQLDTAKVDLVARVKEEVLPKVQDLTLTHTQNLGFMTQLQCDNLMSEKVEYFLKQISILSESLRLEMSTFLHQDLLRSQAMTTQKVDFLTTQQAEMSEKLTKTRNVLKEFSQNVAKALAKKVDLHDFKLKKSRDLNVSVGDEEDEEKRVKSGVASREFDELITAMKTGRFDHDDDYDGSEAEAEAKELHHSSPSRLSHKSRLSTGTKSRLNISSGKKTQLSSSTTTRHHPTTSKTNSKSTTSNKVSNNGDYDEIILQLQHDIKLLQQQFSQPQTPKIDFSKFDFSLSEQAQKLEFLDWRIALGEISTYFRRELAFKVSKDELFSLISDNHEDIKTRLLTLEKSVEEQKVEVKERGKLSDHVKRLEGEMGKLGARVMGELVGARFLWTNGELSSSSFLLWDTQVINASPLSILWRQGAREVTVRVPGLYKITVAVFAPPAVVDGDEGVSSSRIANNKPPVVQVYLNDEPILSYQPISSPSKQTTIIENNVSQDVYYLKRYAHSMGEVTSLLLDEFVSLPPEARLSVRYFASQSAQAFLAIRKM